MWTFVSRLLAIIKDEETKLCSLEVGSTCLFLKPDVFEAIPGIPTSCVGSLSTSECQLSERKLTRIGASLNPTCVVVRRRDKSTFQIYPHGNRETHNVSAIALLSRVWNISPETVMLFFG
ncbi:hypothetical protein WAI453_002055 [Rhynchosporium graminicola]